ncbi:beta-1,6-galactosyltransferase GALT29A [Euphorbia lathyris]|uniref:beta-1,6-galactosyltransferase GALT29A n=1 Tax=Euphorbia lathyris TaxID=212925 RepID=UPI0033135B60
MPKFIECEDGSNTDFCKIPVAYLRWPDLAVAASFIAPMKRSVRPFFSVLLLITFAITLSYRILLRRGIAGGGGAGSFYFSSVELKNNVIPHKPAPIFNLTLLKYAAIQIGEEKAKHEIESLLEGKLANQGKNFATYRRFNRHDSRASTSRGIPVVFRSPQFYRYWLDFRRVLHDWARIKKYQASIMNELGKLLKDPIDKHNGVLGSKLKYTSCAVVGNSGILLQKEFGDLIDSHEIVIRLNNARIVNFQKHVGSKTNISFINSNILHICGRRLGCYCHPYGENVPIVMYICQPLHFLDYTICNSSRKSENSKKVAPLIVTDPRFDVLCSRIVKYYSLKRFIGETGRSVEDWAGVHDGSLFHYSSGFQAVMLAAGVCERVSLFGFGKGSSAKHHYHTNQKNELSLHDYEAEYDFYHDLENGSMAIPFVSERLSFRLW